MFRISAERHAKTYAEIPECFRPGMTDLEFQYEIEKRMRKNGSIGLFRAFGANMDIFMGSILAGENAEVPSPFDFALGGSGIDASCPLGANGTPLKEGTAIMVDMAGNYTAYMTDMTRVFSVGHLTELAYRAHQTALLIESEIENIARPGTPCAELYEIAAKIKMCIRDRPHCVATGRPVTDPVYLLDRFHCFEIYELSFVIYDL